MNKIWSFMQEYSDYYRRDHLMNLYWSAWIFASIMAIIAGIRLGDSAAIIEFSIVGPLSAFCLIHNLLLEKRKKQEKEGKE